MRSRSHWVITLGLLAIVASPSRANPASEASANSDLIIDAGSAFIDGVRYRKFTQGTATILVPTFWSLAAEDFERATCANRTSGENVGGERAIVRAELAQGASRDAQPYVELIQQTIRTRCFGDTRLHAVAVDPHLDVGVTIPTSPDSPLSQRVKLFNRDLGKNLNLGIDF